MHEPASHSACDTVYCEHVKQFSLKSIKIINFHIILFEYNIYFTMEEKLIEAVRPHKILYDTSHADYMKSKLKNDLWDKIADDLELKNGK